MRKRLSLWQSFVSYKIAYRSEIFIWMILDTLPLLVMLLVWIAVYANQTTLRGYTLSQVTEYYLWATFIMGISANHFEQWRVQQIREGQIDFFLTRPLSFLEEIWWTEIAGKSVYLLLIMPVFICLFWLVSLWLGPFAWTPLTWSSLGWFAVLMIGSFLVEFFLALIIVLIGFWVEGADGLEHFKWLAISLTSGSMIPVKMMPAWLQSVVAWSPFQFLYAVPIGVIQHTSTVSITQLLLFVGFIGCLWLVALILWSKAKYQYASAGG